MTNSVKSEPPKIAKAGKLEIAINHFTTDLTSLPYWMDGNCYIVFSLLWRRYISASINERLITPDPGIEPRSPALQADDLPTEL